MPSWFSRSEYILPPRATMVVCNGRTKIGRQNVQVLAGMRSRCARQDFELNIVPKWPRIVYGGCQKPRTAYFTPESTSTILQERTSFLLDQDFASATSPLKVRTRFRTLSSISRRRKNFQSCLRSSITHLPMFRREWTWTF